MIYKVIVKHLALQKGEVACVLPKGHALAGRRTLKPKDLRDESFVSYMAGSRFRHEIDCVFEGAGVERYARTTGYLLDSEGVVRQVFPMETYNRPRWWAVLHEIDRLFPE